jgi:menaquinone-9 beta-reductase
MLQQRSQGDPYDVVIVGARCAGSPLATLLSRRGLRVCLLDRADFPSDSPSTHGIQPPGVKILGELGVLDRLLELAPPIDTLFMALQKERVEHEDLESILGIPMLNVRRLTLDAILLEAAADAGAEVRTKTTVTGLIRDADRVVGVETTAGPLNARLVVGADGARSTIARLVEAPEYHRTAPKRAFLWSYYEGVAEHEQRVWIGGIGENAFLASPTDGGLFLAAFVAPIEQREALRSDRTGAFEAGVQRWPELGEALAPGRRVAPVQLMSRWYGFFRQATGPGWALLGDAGHFKDPTAGQGISDALRHATTLAPAIEQSLTEGRDDPLRAWWRQRDSESWEMYWFSQQIGDSSWAPLLNATLASHMAAHPDLVVRFLRVLCRDLPVSQFLTPRAALSVLTETLRDSPGQRRQILEEVGGILLDEVRRTALQASGLRRPR